MKTLGEEGGKRLFCIHCLLGARSEGGLFNFAPGCFCLLRAAFNPKSATIIFSDSVGKPPRKGARGLKTHTWAFGFLVLREIKLLKFLNENFGDV